MKTAKSPLIGRKAGKCIDRQARCFLAVSLHRKHFRMETNGKFEKTVRAHHCS